MDHLCGYGSSILYLISDWNHLTSLLTMLPLCVSLTNAALLGTIYDFAVPCVVNGVGGSMTIYQEGYLPVIGRVLCCPDFTVSFISQSEW